MSRDSWASVPFLEAVSDESRGHAKIKRADYQSVGPLAVVDQGQGLIGGFTGNEAAASRVQRPVIIFGDHTRAVKYVDFPFAVGADGVKVLKPSPGVDARYLYHYMKSLRITDGGYSRHFKYLKEVEVPLPPIEEQRRIAAVLDATDDLRAKRREALAKLDTLTQAIFIDMFGDPNTLGPGEGVRMDLLFKDLSGGQAKTKQRDFLWAGKYPLVDQGRQLIGGFTDDEEVLADCELPVVVFGDHTRAVKLVDFRFGVGADGVKLLAPAAGTHAVYLYWVLRLLDLPSAGYSRHFKFLRDRFAFLPSWSLQLRFAELVESIEARRHEMRAAADSMGGLFASLQQRAFRGEL